MKTLGLALAAGVFLVGCQSTATQHPTTTTQSNSSSYSALSGVALSSAMQLWGQQSAGATTLASSVQQATNVSNQQAVGGVGALLGFAQNSLTTEQNSELASLVPGYSALSTSGLLPMLTNNSAVNSAFSALGMDASMASTFAPIILSTLQSQGASATLLSALSSVWQ